MTPTQSVSLYRRCKQMWRAGRQIRKEYKLALGRKLFDRRVSSESFDPALVNSIVLMRWDDKIGDNLMATIFVDGIKAVRPDIRITYITGKVGVELLQQCAAIDHLEVCGRRSWRAAWKLGQRFSGFDLVVEPQTSMSSVELFALRRLKGKHYMGFDKADYRLFDVAIPLQARHFTDRYAAAARLVTQKEVVPEFYLPAGEKEKRVAQEFWGRAPAGQVKVLVNLFGSARHRCFSLADAERLLRHWLGRAPEHYLVLLSVPGRAEMLRELAGRIASERVQQSPEPPTLALSCALARSADLIFSPDTAMVHIAIALRKPLVAVYRESEENTAEWGPRGDNVAVVHTRVAQGRHDRVNVAEFDFNDFDSALQESVQGLLG
jgi:ADP-heptose:LPS heptosyltransferase